MAVADFPVQHSICNMSKLDTVAQRALFLYAAEEGIRDWSVTGVQTCALPIWTKHPVTIKYYDDTSSANQSAVLMQKLITEDKANFLLGPYGSAATATDAAIAEQNQIPMVERSEERRVGKA